MTRQTSDTTSTTAASSTILPAVEKAPGQWAADPASIPPTTRPETTPPRPRAWSTRKKDTDAPRGLFRHPGGGWGIRFRCGLGHLHKEAAGVEKRGAKDTLEDRRVKVRGLPGWCPVAEKRATRQQVREEQARGERTFGALADAYLRAAKGLRGFETEKGRVGKLTAAFGKDRPLDTITPRDVERYLADTFADKPNATRNRYRSRLLVMFGHAVSRGQITSNPAAGTRRLGEPEGRMAWLSEAEEAAILAQLAPDAMLTGRPRFDARRPDLRPLFLVSVHTGLRWSEQRRLVWGDIDMLAGTLTVRVSKSGYSRTVPVNRVVLGALVGLAAQRTRPGDPDEPVFRCPYAQPTNFFPKVVARAQQALRAAGLDASRLDGYTWHGNRHSFASRLVMAGVDLRSVQTLGGWRTLKMVERYSHLSPGHLRGAVERLAGAGGRTELSRNFTLAEAPFPVHVPTAPRMA